MGTTHGPDFMDVDDDHYPPLLARRTEGKPSTALDARRPSYGRDTFLDKLARDQGASAAATDFISTTASRRPPTHSELRDALDRRVK